MERKWSKREDNAEENNVRIAPGIDMEITWKSILIYYNILAH